MRTRQTAWIVGLASLLLLLGMATAEVRLLALVLPLLVYLVLAATFPAPPPQVAVTRTATKEVAVEGERVEVTVEVENRGPSLEFLELQDEVPGDLEVVEGSNYLVTPLPPNAARTFQYTVELGVRGRYELGPLQLRSRDLMGLFLHEAAVGEPLALTVSPRREDVGRVKIWTRTTRPWLGQIPSRSPGPGTDFWSIRDYVSGDEMRRINWKASGRLDTLLTNQYEGERSGDFVLILDAREEAAHGPAQENAVAMGVRATVSLAEKLLAERNRVGLIVMRSVLDWVYPAFGRRALHRIVQALVTVRPGGEWTLGHLSWILTRFFPPRSQLLIVTPLVDRSTQEAVAELRARGFETIVLSPSMVDVEANFLGEEDERVRTAHAILRLERGMDIIRLRRFAPVADWRPGEPLAVALKEVEVRRPIPPR